jgi:hypothetical protein
MIATLTNEKRCTRCGAIKSVDAFNRHQGRRDGREAQCRQCRHQLKAYAYHVGGGKSQRLVYYAQYQARRVPRSEHRLEYDRGRRHSDKARARDILALAVRAGRVQKPDSCEVCGQLAKGHRLHGHHADYQAPLDVSWQCTTCHADTHLVGARIVPEWEEVPK